MFRLALLRAECAESMPSGQRYYSLSSGTFELFDCNFFLLSSYSGDGAVVRVTGLSDMIIKKCSFGNCNCGSNNGGAIYGSSMKILIESCCAYDCIAYSGCFLYITGTNAYSLQKVSILNCPSGHNGHHPMRTASGQQQLTQVNSSGNKVIHTSGICIESPSSLLCSFCTFADNKSSYHLCFYLYGSTPNRNVANSNFVNNYQTDSSYGVVHVDGSAAFTKCIFADNYQQLFTASSSVTLTDSFIQHSFGLGGNLLTTSCKFERTSTHAIAHFSTQMCPADIKELVISQKYHSVNPKLVLLGNFLLF